MTQLKKRGIIFVMKLINLTKTSNEPILFNWDNVVCVVDSSDSFGNEYCEVHTIDGGEVQVKEKVSEIKSKLIN